MKISLNRSFLASFIVIMSFISLHAMEPLAEEHAFLKSMMLDVQHYYYIPSSDSDVIEESLEVLGLGYSNTPLDIRYHYELMKGKELDNKLDIIITQAYQNLINIFLRINRQETNYLLHMSFEELQNMELKENSEFSYDAFMERTDKSVNKAIAQLESQYPTIKEFSETIQQLLNLPANASPHTVDQHYKNYVQDYKDYTNRLIAHATMKNISTDELKDRLAKLEKVVQAYNRYAKKRDKK